MSHGINSFKIKLHKLTGSYVPGEKIYGEVIIDLVEDKIIQALTLQIKGTCEVSWKENNYQVDSFSAKEKYIESVIILRNGESHNTNRIKIDQGHNVFLFNFTLPHNIPSTLKHDCAEIKYSITAIMERPWKFNHETEKSFRVERQLPIDESYLLGIDETDVENFSCLIPCIKRGLMKYRIRLPSTGYTCGERISFMLNIDNKLSSVEITTITLLLIQKLKFSNREPFLKSKTETNIITRVVRQGPFQKVSATLLEIDVQKLPLSHCQYCKYIDIKYLLHSIITVSGCHKPIQKTYDICIGTKDIPETMPLSTREISNTNSPSVPLQSPSIPPPIDLATVDNPPTRDIDLIYSHTDSEDPPPSYETVMAIDNLRRLSKT
ncbi:arrestin domain-containing protein 17-like [Microplitis mediator]|uniref:arrestin domain-containing protein 17-like n=1 Tax=Microplitis mediator TaxID=375433 RepID=UPI0025533F71|nr:arrestin domain-containing protein 17-like [Microplitis mediator]